MTDCSKHKLEHSIDMKFKDLFSFLGGKNKGKKSLGEKTDFLSDLLEKESANLVALDRNYYELVSERVENFNGRVISVAYEKDLGRLRIVYPGFYIDFATIDINLVDLLALFGLGLPNLKLKIAEKSMELEASLEDYSYVVNILGVNLNYDIENLS